MSFQWLHQKKHTLFYGCVFVGLLLLSFYSGYYLKQSRDVTYFENVRPVSGGSHDPYLRSALGVDPPNALTIGAFAPLDKKIRDVLSDQTEAGNLLRYSVYFRDLNNGLWIGINENDKYDPASLLKVALAIAAYKQYEDDDLFLNRSVTYTDSIARLNTTVDYASPSLLQVGANYTVKELLRYMIVNSDNGAKDLLANTINKKITEDVFSDLGIDNPGADSENYKISARKYALFFRALYNASYLNRDDSNALLTLLIEPTFKDGLVSGVPGDVNVAHKFGERLDLDKNKDIQSVELHDCGIVYHTRHPYLLCVMTQTYTLQAAEATISSVSQVVYNSVDGDYK
jgi:beta-lactamase class A